MLSSNTQAKHTVSPYLRVGYGIVKLLLFNASVDVFLLIFTNMVSYTPYNHHRIGQSCFRCIVMQEASDAHSKTADSDTVSTYQVSSVQLVTDTNCTEET